MVFCSLFGVVVSLSVYFSLFVALLVLCGAGSVGVCDISCGCGIVGRGKEWSAMIELRYSCCTSNIIRTPIVVTIV